MATAWFDSRPEFLHVLRNCHWWWRENLSLLHIYCPSINVIPRYVFSSTMFAVSTLSLQLLGRGSVFWHVKKPSCDLFFLDHVRQWEIEAWPLLGQPSTSYDLQRSRYALRSQLRLLARFLGEVTLWRRPPAKHQRPVQQSEHSRLFACARFRSERMRTIASARFTWTGLRSLRCHHFVTYRGHPCRCRPCLLLRGQEPAH
jgi:hypothetical protein